MSTTPTSPSRPAPNIRFRLAVGLIVIAAGAAVTLMVGGDMRIYAFPALLGLAVAAIMALLMPETPRAAPSEDAEPTRTETPLLRTISKQIEDRQPSIDERVLGAQYRRQRREETEGVVNALLDDFIAIVRARLDVNTVAIFFPTADNGYRIQRCSSRSEFVNHEAVIYPGVGVIGSFLKDGLRQLKLQEVVSDSKTLYYYTRDVGIRSVLGCPIITAGVVRGWVIVDSTEASFFSDEDHSFLNRVAQAISHTVYYAYQCNEYRIKHDHLVAMTSAEKEFFTHLEMGAILDRMIQIIPFAVACDRLSISLKQEEGTSAKIVRVHGEQSKQLLDLEFNLSERGLVPLVYERRLCIFRDFTADRYETRYSENEPQDKGYLSFMAVPIVASDCRGALLLESLRPDAYSETHRALLDRLATSAGVALEKLENLERERARATHDGLTGLVNHRQFQALLQEQLIRTKRYAEPLALVLCDIDHFKRCNDTYGHPFGDIVLKGVSEKLREGIRAGGDVAARYGGEEFALVLLKTDQASAVETVDRIRETIAKLPFREPRGEEVHVTMSFGIALFGADANNTTALVKHADQALYRAKSNGRNRIEVY